MKRSARIACVILLVSAAPVVAQAPVPPQPARFLDGSIPGVSPLAASGGDVALSVAVSSTGTVGQIDVLRTTPPFTDDVVMAVRTWRFSPATDSKKKAIDSRVLVDVVIGAPSLNVPTLGTPPKDVSTSDMRVPFPAQKTTPLYPVNANAAGTVLVEARVDPTGHVTEATVVRTQPPFDLPALDAAKSWTFRPAAQGPDLPALTNVYLLFIFRQPVVGGAPVQKQ